MRNIKKHPCIDCGKLIYPNAVRCQKCYHKSHYGIKSPRWDGGKCLTRDGYVRVRLQPDDFFYPMANIGYVFEHRLVMAKSLNRCLLSWEIVHHKNGNRADNRIENLELFKGQVKHLPSIFLIKKVNRLELENKRLKVRVETLESRITIFEAEQIISNKIISTEEAIC